MSDVSKQNSCVCYTLSKKPFSGACYQKHTHCFFFLNVFIALIASIGKNKEKLARMYEVKDPNVIFVFKLRNHFGGAKSTCLD
ncbi:unnamed protein product [Lactuca virosa]|uniref:Uncharacterized protein n=1 Tax=Lactuca virosa TaxID=75947 RepID=A0AAU9N355_9ASTR|nr:unnamed protein product [Lactuca virosa]